MRSAWWQALHRVLEKHLLSASLLQEQSRDFLPLESIYLCTGVVWVVHLSYPQGVYLWCEGGGRACHLGGAEGKVWQWEGWEISCHQIFQIFGSHSRIRLLSSSAMSPSRNSSQSMLRFESFQFYLNSLNHLWMCSGFLTSVRRTSRSLPLKWLSNGLNLLRLTIENGWDWDCRWIVLTCLWTTQASTPTWAGGSAWRFDLEWLLNTRLLTWNDSSILGSNTDKKKWMIVRDVGSSKFLSLHIRWTSLV